MRKWEKVENWEMRKWVLQHLMVSKETDVASSTWKSYLGEYGGCSSHKGIMSSWLLNAVEYYSLWHDKLTVRGSRHWKRTVCLFPSHFVLWPTSDLSPAASWVSRRHSSHYQMKESAPTSLPHLCWKWGNPVKLQGYYISTAKNTILGSFITGL